MYSADQLRTLARFYLAATGLREEELGALILNRKFIRGLLDGRDVMAGSAERASKFFDERWPPIAAWPDTVPRRNAHCTAHQTQSPTQTPTQTTTNDLPPP